MVSARAPLRKRCLSPYHCSNDKKDFMPSFKKSQTQFKIIGFRIQEGTENKNLGIYLY